MKYIDFLKQGIELRSEGETNTVAGVIPYNTRSLPMGFEETILPTAFRKTVNDGFDVKGLLNHDSSKPLARVGNGSLKLENREDGLHFEMELNPKITYHHDLLESVRSGVVEGVSFGFQVIKDNVKKEGKKILRELQEVALKEISVGVTFPAYPDAESYVRELQEEISDKLEEDQPDEPTEQDQANESKESAKSTLQKLEEMERELQLLKLEI
jgi:HK97 family phage prohead protease